jgi:hypothetical protein
MKRRLNRKGRSDEPLRHVRLYHVMLRGKAWRSLDPVARALYVEISARYRGPGSNNGRIPYSVREGAKALGSGKTKVADALRALQERGFIVLMSPGGFNLKTRHAAEWRLTEFGCDVTGALATQDYERWEPPQIQNTVPTSGPSVPTSGQYGTHTRTEAAQNRPFPALTVPVRGQ